MCRMIVLNFRTFRMFMAIETRERSSEGALDMKRTHSSSRGPADDRSRPSSSVAGCVCPVFYATGFSAFHAFHCGPCGDVGCAALCDRDVASDALARDQALDGAVCILETGPLVVRSGGADVVAVGAGPTGCAPRVGVHPRRHDGGEVGAAYLWAGVLSGPNGQEPGASRRRNSHQHWPQ